MIPNNYSEKTAKGVWEEWSHDQREHFIIDHAAEIKKQAEINKETIGPLYKYSSDSYDTLPEAVKFNVFYHVSQGQYGKGGIIKTIWNFLNEKVYFNK